MRRRAGGREHRPVPEQIFDLAERVVEGQIRLPKFQREFVWSREQVLDLLDSIARGYPIGSFLLCDSTDFRLASEDAIAGLAVDPQEDDEAVKYLIDGRQRLSTIAGALYWTAEEDPESYWNLVYDLEQEKFRHRADLADPPAHELPLRVLPDPPEFLDQIKHLPPLLLERATALFRRFQKYEVSVVTLQETSLSEIGKIFQRVNTRGTPLTTVELVRAATWTKDFDLLEQIDRVRGTLADKHYGLIEHRLLLRAIAAAAGYGFSNDAMGRLADVSALPLRTAVTETEAAARHAVDFLTTEIGTPTAESLPYPNQLAVVIEIFRRVPKPTSQQFAKIRSWFWSTVLSGYFEGWSPQKMAADYAAIKKFASGGESIEVVVSSPNTELWLQGQYRRGTARTKALALMLAAAGPRDLRTGNRIDAGRALASANAMEFHHFFPQQYLIGHGTTFENANVLANIAMLTALSNQRITDKAPGDYLREIRADCGEAEFMSRLGSMLISPPALEEALANNYEQFRAARANTLLDWAISLIQGQTPSVSPFRAASPVRLEPTDEIKDRDTED